MENHTAESCSRAKLAIRDTLDVVGGKWKLVLISVLQSGKKGFNELSRDAGISPRILSKELQEMEMNGLVRREVRPTKPITVQYELTPYSQTLNEVLTAMEKWGHEHRQKIVLGN
jgi:DNA-binding HxlR family transcriptional regulator